MEDLISGFHCLERRLQGFMGRRTRSPSSAEENQITPGTGEDFD